MSRKVAFSPIVDQQTKVLMLGTMPSEESLRKQQYYGHPNNQFWKLLFTMRVLQNSQPYISIDIFKILK